MRANHSPFEYSARFESIFPNAHRLKDPARGLAAFRLAGSNPLAARVRLQLLSGFGEQPDRCFGIPA